MIHHDLNTSDPTSTTGTGEPVPARSRRRIRHLAGSGLRVILAMAFGSAGLMKLGGTPEMVTLFDQIGAGQWFRYAIGSLELAGAIGVLIPRVSGLAALGLTILMAGATVTNIILLHTSPLIPLPFLVLAVLATISRRQQLKAIASRAGVRLSERSSAQPNP